MMMMTLSYTVMRIHISSAQLLHPHEVRWLLGWKLETTAEDWPTQHPSMLQSKSTPIRYVMYYG